MTCNDLTTKRSFPGGVVSDVRTIQTRYLELPYDHVFHLELKSGDFLTNLRVQAARDGHS